MVKEDLYTFFKEFMSTHLADKAPENAIIIKDVNKEEEEEEENG